jgi:hypothetical protein
MVKTGNAFKILVENLKGRPRQRSEVKGEGEGKVVPVL